MDNSYRKYESDREQRSVITNYTMRHSCNRKKEDDLIKQIKELNDIISDLQLKNAVLQTEIYKSKQEYLHHESLDTWNIQLSRAKLPLKLSHKGKTSILNDNSLNDYTIFPGIDYKAIVDELIKLIGVFKIYIGGYKTD
jgi:hypothetical protein